MKESKVSLLLSLLSIGHGRQPKYQLLPEQHNNKTNELQYHKGYNSFVDIKKNDLIRCHALEKKDGKTHRRR